MAWIESHQELGRHPKARKLARFLDVSLPTTIGHLHLLWWWALDFAQDGDLSRYDVHELAEAALWEGDAGTFVAALARAGFVDLANDAPDSSPVCLHDWDDYAGKLLDQRRANAKRQQDWRNRHKTDTATATSTDMNDTASSHNGHVTVTSPSRNAATEPNPTIPYPTLISAETDTEQDTDSTKGSAAAAVARTHVSSISASATSTSSRDSSDTKKTEHSLAASLVSRSATARELCEQIAKHTQLSQRPEVMEQLSSVIGTHLARGLSPGDIWRDVLNLTDPTRPGHTKRPSISRISNWLAHTHPAPELAAVGANSEHDSRGAIHHDRQRSHGFNGANGYQRYRRREPDLPDPTRNGRWADRVTVCGDDDPDESTN